MPLFRIEFIDYNTKIEAPVEDVFHFFKQVEKWPTWASGIKQASCRSTGQWRKGFQLAITADIAPFPLVVPLVEYKETESIAWGVSFPGGAIIHRFDFKMMNMNQCQVHHTEYAEGVLALLLWPAKKRIAQFDKQFADDLQIAFEAE